jgi:hypothetical protein
MPSKDAIVDFDWDNQILTTRYKGSDTKESIENKTQDLISYLYQFNYENFAEPTIEFAAATGKRVQNINSGITDKKVSAFIGRCKF